MTREEAQELLPIIQAWAEGKSIQYQTDSKTWSDITKDLYPCNHPSLYRIKPEPKYRPFKSQEECWNEMLKHQPFGWVIYKKKYYNIRDVTSKKITILYECDVRCLNFESCTEEVTFADGTPFGVKVEE